MSEVFLLSKPVDQTHAYVETTKLLLFLKVSQSVVGEILHPDRFIFY